MSSKERAWDVILGVVKPLLNQKSPELPTQKWKQAMSLADAAHLVDLMIKNGSLDKIQTDSRFLEIRRDSLQPARNPAVLLQQTFMHGKTRHSSAR